MTITKLISPKVHGILDYFGPLVFVLSPKVLLLSGLVAEISYGLAVFALVLAVTSKAPPGLIKIVPMRVHALAELISAPILLALPWLLGFEADLVARYFFMVAGVSLFTVWLITDYERVSA